jgi:tetraacyldisaccharide 4'-kinase
MKNYLNSIHYSEKIRIKDAFIFIGLVFCSIFYGITVRIRNLLYKLKILKEKKLPVYVISVGNLTTGGTGKTPFTCELVKILSEGFEKKPGIISRGYGGGLSVKNTNIISDGKKVFYNAVMAGDEPYWIAKNSKNSVVITGKNRLLSGKTAVEMFNTDILLLDDGFQYLKVKRDLNILLIDANKVFGNKFLLPAGPLREPESAIKRADRIVIVNKTPFNKESEEKAEYLKQRFQEKYNIKTLVCNFEAGEIYDLLSGEIIKIGHSALGFCAIAQPEFFFNYLEEKNIVLASKIIFPDHYLYTCADIKEIIKHAELRNIECIITTEKDAVKIEPLKEKIKTSLRFCALKLQVNLDVEELDIFNENTHCKI